MPLSVEKRNGVVILRITPSHDDFFFALRGFVDTAEQLAAEGNRNGVVDLSRVPWIGSLMLGALCNALLTFRKAGGDLVIVLDPASKAKAIVEASDLGEFLMVFTTVEEAVAAVGSRS